MTEAKASPRYPGVDLPRIEPVADGVARPFWSVMITVYNRTTYLAAALESVLAQDPGPEEMEIVVVDDCSPDVDVEPIVRAVGKGRVSLHRRPTNSGLSSTWTECVRRARGRWIHILHDDDAVLPGFYARLRAGIESRPEVGAAYCRHVFMDEDDNWFAFSRLERKTPGILEGWLDEITAIQRIQCPSIVVRRDAYEHLGGFHPGLVYALDWDMWKRVASAYDFWYDPRPMACYRVHTASETKRLEQLGRTVPDILECIEISRHYVPSERAEELIREARRQYAARMLRAIRDQRYPGGARGVTTGVRTAIRISPSPQTWLLGAKMLTGATKQWARSLAKSGVLGGVRALRRLTGSVPRSRRGTAPVGGVDANRSR